MPRCLVRGASIWLVVLPVLVLLSACGAGGSGSSARPSVTASFEPTRSLAPTRTLAPTQSPSVPETTASAPATSAAASSAPAAEPGASSGSSGAGNGWWWLVAAVVIVGLALALLLRRRSHRAWDTQLVSATHEVGWFASELVPQLRRSGSAAAALTGWSVAASRVADLEDRLSTLVTTAPGQEQRTRATVVRDAVRRSREEMTAMTADGGRDWEARLDGVQTLLSAALAPPAPGTRSKAP